MVALSLLCPMPAFCVGFSVKGIVVDSLSGDRDAFATIRIVRQNETRAAVVSGTDENGGFSEKLPSAGKYRLTVTSTGKHSFGQSFSVSDSLPEYDFGRIALRSAVELEEVSVEAKKSLVKSEIDKLSYNVEGDPDSKTKTAIEILRKVPLVTVDGQDNITVNGSSNFKVYVNGKPNTLMSSNPKEVLKSMPAATVKSIEVITDPGAKYDAEGVGGILNIVTDGVKMQGYNLSVGLNGNNRGPSGYFYGTAQLGKFMVSGNYAYNYMDQGDVLMSSERVDYDRSGNDSQVLRRSSVNRQKQKFQYGSLEGSYEHDTLNLISFSLNFFHSKVNSDGSEAVTMSDAAGNPLYSYRIASPTSHTFGMVGTNVDYQRSFKRKGEFLTASYRYDNSPNKSRLENIYSDGIDVPYDLSGRIQDIDAHTGEHTLQLDYVNPITAKHYVDGGMKFISRRNDSDSRTFMQQPDGGFAYDGEASSDFLQKQNILGLYADYQLKSGKFGLKTGVRYEHTFMSIDYALSPEQNFSAGFDDVVPSATMSYSLGTASTLTLNYNMRLRRPGIWYLNPFRRTSVNSVSYGNPDLDTEKAHVVGLGYGRFSQHFNMNLRLNYNFADDGIEGYSFVEDGILHSTYGNIVKRQVTSLTAWLNWNPTVRTRLTLNAHGSYSDYKSEQLGSHNSGFFLSTYGSVDQQLPWKLRLNVYGGWTSPRIMHQQEGFSSYFYGLTLNRSFLKDDRLEVALFASDFLHGGFEGDSYAYTPTYRMTERYEYSTWRVGVSVSWRFGDLKAQVKRAARTIKNDDLQSGGGNSGGGNSGGK